ERIDRRRRWRNATRNRRDRQSTLRAVLEHQRKLRRRNRESHQDRTHLVDHHERLGSTGADEIALLHEQTARLSGDWSTNDRVLEIESRLRHARAITPKCRRG